MDLALPNARQRPLAMEVLRELTSEDMERIAAGRETQTTTPALQKIRTTHHELARVLALGASDIEASALTGYTPNRVCLLKKDPSFEELIAHYSTLAEHKVAEVKERMRVAGLTALEILTERLEEDPEGWTKQELQALAKMTLVDGLKEAPQAAAVGPALNIEVSFVPTPARALVADIVQPGGGRVYDQIDQE